MLRALTCFVWLVYIYLAFVSGFCSLCHAVESPHYTVVHSEPDYEVRLYKEISWLSVLVQGTSFQKSTKDGFHRIYRYIHGANLNSSRFPITAPVLTSITQSSNEYTYVVRLFVPINFSATLPRPNPDIDLQLEKWRSQCMAVRRFSGFAKEDNISKEAEALASSLKEHLTRNSSVLSSYSIAQYNASHYLSGRLNEVWMDLPSVSTQGCLPNQKIY